MHLMPTNKTGENPSWQSSEPYYNDIFTFWDIYRCTTALLHILHPTYCEELLRSMIDTFCHQGWVSDARSSFSTGTVQGVTNGDNVFADAYVKGVRGKVNWNDAFAAMLKNAEVEPPNNHDSRDPTGGPRRTALLTETRIHNPQILAICVPSCIIVSNLNPTPLSASNSPKDSAAPSTASPSLSSQQVSRRPNSQPASTAHTTGATTGKGI